MGLCIRKVFLLYNIFTIEMHQSYGHIYCFEVKDKRKYRTEIVSLINYHIHGFPTVPIFRIR